MLALSSFTLQGRTLSSLNSSQQLAMDSEAMHIDDSAHTTEGGGSSTAVGDDTALLLPSASPEEEAVQYLNMYVVPSISPSLE